MKRILILGSPGSGKSTLARRMGEKLRIPAAHMDALFWKSGWVQSGDPEIASKLKKILKGKSWVIDGNYMRFLDMRLKRADTVVYLNINKWICRWRILQRSLIWVGRQRPDMAQGCPEKMDLEFYRWSWNFDGSKILSKVLSLGRKHRVILLNKPREVSGFLDSLGSHS